MSILGKARAASHFRTIASVFLRPIPADMGLCGCIDKSPNGLEMNCLGSTWERRFSLFLASFRRYRLIGREDSVAFFSGFFRSDRVSKMSFVSQSDPGVREASVPSEV